MNMKGDVSESGKKFFTIHDSVENEKTVVPFDEERFRQLYWYEPVPKTSLGKAIREKVKCGAGTLPNVFPILNWLPNYEKSDLARDVLAGLTVGVMHIPQGMAYALLGGVPPIVGIYMAFFPVLPYIIMGTSRHVSMGTFAVVCMMTGKSVDALAGGDGGPTPTEVATAVCIVVGFWQIVLSVLKLGSLSVLLSQTLVSGFTTGAAVHVLTSQIKNLLGIKVKRYSGPLKIIHTYVDIFQNVRDLNTVATILSIAFILFLIVFNEFAKPYLKKKCKRDVPIPAELIVVILGTLISKNLNLKEEYGISVVDSVPTGLPNPKIPPLNLLPDLVLDGLVVAIVALSINISMATIFAQKLGYEIDGNQEILASGVGNVFSSFFSCMPFAASLSRSLIQESVGGKTQLTSVVSASSLVLVLLFVGPFFEPLPYCVLSTVIVVALKGMFKQMGDVPAICRGSWLDGSVWLTTFLSVVVLDIDYGLGIGLLTSVASLLIRNQKFQVQTLGRVPNTNIYLDVEAYKKAQHLQNVLILRVIGGIHFANSGRVKKEILLAFLRFSKNGTIFLEPQKQNRTPFLIVDLSCVPFVDPSAAKSLASVFDSAKIWRFNLLICGCLPSVYESLTIDPSFENHPKSFIFHDLNDAVDFAVSSEA